jgi:nucleotide-binding universal stress UspA family protein
MNEHPILICYDGTEGARRAVEAAAALFVTRRAVVVDVAPVVTAAETYAMMASPYGGAEIEQLNAEQASSVAMEGAAKARSVGFTAEPRDALAEPTWQGIVDAADDVDAAAIVLGSRGLSGVRERFEGSVSHQVAQHARRPVLIVPPPHEENHR